MQYRNIIISEPLTVLEVEIIWNTLPFSPFFQLLNCINIKRYVSLYKFAWFIITSCNHKTLGLYYLWFTFLFGIFGYILSIIIRIELYNSSIRIISNENQNFYNLTFTIHGLVMIFFTLMPGLYGGFGNYYVPIYTGTPEVAYPRVNSISLVLVPISFATVIMSMVVEFGAGAGWTLYPPLSTSLMSLSPTSIDVIIIGLVISGLSSFLTSLNFITTICHMRARGYSNSSMVFNNWALIFTAIMLVVTLPILTGGLLMVLSDLHLSTQFYDPVYSGDPVLYQHLFWFFGHPEVYVLILPAFAVVSQVLSTTTSKTLFGYQAMILAMGCISILGTLVWGHHMMTVGLEADTRAYFTAVTILISLPTGTKIFNWLCTYMGTYFHVSTASTLFALSFVLLFTLGGTTGVVLGNAAVDISLHDTYYVVAHFHFVLSLGAIIALFSGASHFQENFFGHNMVHNTNQILFALVFLVGVLLIFIPLHILGFNVMPRRIPDYADSLSYINSLASISSLMTLFAFLIL